MRGSRPSWRARELEALLILEHLEHFGHCLGPVARLGREHETEPVGLHLVLAPVALYPRARAEVGELADRAGARGERRADREDVGEQPLRAALLRMFRGDVGDLVAEHRREFGLVVEVAQQAAMDVDEAAAGRERVDRVVVEHEELELGVRPVAVARDAGADLVDVVLHRLVFVETVELQDFAMRLARRLALGVLFGRARRGRGNGRGENRERDEDS